MTVTPRFQPSRVRRLAPIAVLFAVLVATALTPTARAEELQWVRQFGSGYPTAFDAAQAIDVSGNVYVVGNTSGLFPGEAGFGGPDVFLRKYDADGNLAWTRVLGSPDYDGGAGVAVDDTGVYVLGTTYGALPGETNQGLTDSFVGKYDPDGDVVWTRQFGGSGFDDATGIAVDADGVYIVGIRDSAPPVPPPPGPPPLPEMDGWVLKLDKDGSPVWERQIATPANDDAYAIAAYGGELYVAGSTQGVLGAASVGLVDAYVRKYDGGGTVVWTSQFGSSSFDTATGLAVSDGGVYAAGHTYGDFGGTGAGSYDVFVRKLDGADGTGLWTRQFGSTTGDYARGAATDGTWIYVAGQTYGALPDQTKVGYVDSFVCVYDADGSPVWTEQFGAAGPTYAYAFTAGVAAEDAAVYLAGYTNGALPGQSAVGSYDAFVRKYAYTEGSGWAEDWTRQFGSYGPGPFFDAAQDVDAAGNVYLGGYTFGTLPEQSRAGNYDAFLRKLDVDGNVLWTDQFGTWNHDYVRAVEVHASGIYVAGHVGGALPGQTGYGVYDAFVRKYDESGGVLWTHQFGTTQYDYAWGVAADATGVYVVGHTRGNLAGQVGTSNYYDAVVRKLDHGGEVLWTKQFGSTTDDAGYAAAADGSGVFVAGYASGPLPGGTFAGGRDAYVRKYDPSGGVVWTEQFGTGAWDVANGLAADGSSVYVAGATQGILGASRAGGFDAFVRKLDGASGAPAWTDQFGGMGHDSAQALDTVGSVVYVAGYVGGNFPGYVCSGNADAFLRKVRSDGTEMWTHEFGTPSCDLANGVSATSFTTYVAGYTDGTFPSQSSWGAQDIFLAKFASNAAPTVESVTVPVEPVAIDDQPLVATAALGDPDGAGEVLSCTVDFGDGSAPQIGLVVGSDCEASHTYGSAGVYRVSVQVADQDGASGLAAATDLVVIYDADAGFVTGGGWIDSPAGAFVADPTLTGRASFGFVAKYIQGENRPSGSTEFQFRAGGLNFHSTDYAWLAVNNHVAKYKGTGTINGAGSYGFMVSAIDADNTPSADSDLFRIKIWDEADDDAVVYDNQLGTACASDDDAEPCTAIGGGSIKIHRP